MNSLTKKQKQELAMLAGSQFSTEKVVALTLEVLAVIYNHLGDQPWPATAVYEAMMALGVASAIINQRAGADPINEEFHKGDLVAAGRSLRIRGFGHA